MEDGWTAGDGRATGDGRRATGDAQPTNDGRRTTGDDGRPTDDDRRTGDGRTTTDGRATDGRRATGDGWTTNDGRRTTDGRRTAGDGRKKPVGSRRERWVGTWRPHGEVTAPCPQHLPRRRPPRLQGGRRRRVRRRRRDRGRIGTHGASDDGTDYGRIVIGSGYASVCASGSKASHGAAATPWMAHQGFVRRSSATAAHAASMSVTTARPVNDA